MFANGPILIEVVLVPGVAFAWGLWELRALAKLRKALEQKERDAAERKPGPAADISGMSGSPPARG